MISPSNRIVTWGEHGITYEPDQRHADVIIHELGLIGKQSVVTPGIKRDDEKDEEQDQDRLDPVRESAYRGTTARANYLAQDRLDIRYAVKELSRWMSKPRNKDWKRLIRLGKYLIGRERYKMEYGYQDVPGAARTLLEPKKAKEA